MNYDFDKVINRKGTNSIKWEFMSQLSDDLPEDTIPLWVADMDFECPQPIIDALHSRVDKKIFGYSSYETEKYYDSVTGWMKRRFDWDVKREDIFVTQGIVEGIDNLIKLFTSVGDGVIIQEPVYYPFSEKIIKNDRVVVNNLLLNNEGYYTMDFEDLKAKAEDDNTKMMILCSPHNPVGRIWTPEELEEVANICLSNGVLLISDEVHFDVIRKDAIHYPITKVVNDDRIIVCTAPSKTFNLAGMKCSNIIIRKLEYKKKWENLFGGFSTINPLSIVAVEAAYNHCEDWLDQVNDYIDKNIEFAMDYLKKELPGAKCISPKGTYLMWVDLSHYVDKQELLDYCLMHDARVLLDSGTMFGKSGVGYQRINVSCPRALLEESLKRISIALRETKNK